MDEKKKKGTKQKTQVTKGANIYKKYLCKPDEL